MSSEDGGGGGGGGGTGEDFVEDDDEEVLDEKPKSLILALIKQYRPGMDISRIALPTFVLERRSMLEKLTDFLSHPHLLLDASQMEDPLDRIVAITRWYLSGFHVKPAGVKKPYNPILGEFFQCEYMVDGARLRYVAEQVSHHPPVSAFHCACRSRNVVINGCYSPRAKFFGNSVGSMGEGLAHIYFLHHNERYEITWPNLYVKGIILGRLRMELAGPVTIRCEDTGLVAELEFKNKGFFGGTQNSISGKIKELRGRKTKHYRIDGRWDRQLFIAPEEDKHNKVVFFDAATEQKAHKRVRKFERQAPNESRKVWVHLTAALQKRDQNLAQICKNTVEDEQRAIRKEREERDEEWEPHYFRQSSPGYWVYRDINFSPYDPSEEDDLDADEEEEEPDAPHLLPDGSPLVVTGSGAAAAAAAASGSSSSSSASSSSSSALASGSR